MPSSITTNMGLIVPTVGQEPGPDWATDLNANLGVLDQHNHSSGQGVPITPSGMNISSDLPFNGNNATTMKTINFQAQVSSLSGVAPNLGCIYVAGKELYYNDEVGNVVQITSSGSVNAGAGSISGLPSGTASASYSGGTFVWQSATNTPANTDTGSVILRNISASSKGLTLSPPNALASDYALTLPSIPASTSFVTIDTSGNMSGSISTTAGITTSMVADGAITSAKLAAGILPGTLTPTIITSSQNYVVPAGVNYVYIIACGGGGGGGGGGWAGGTGSGGVAGGGGGAGAPIWKGILDVTAGSTYAVTIGAGGSSGASGGTSGNGGGGGQGGTTSFGALMSVGGGFGGAGGTSSGSVGTGGAGGTGRAIAGYRGSNATTGGSSIGGVAYTSDIWDGAGGTGASGNTGSGAGGGFGAGGGGSIGAGQHGTPSGSPGTGGGGGGGNGGAGPNAASAGGAGGAGYMEIYVI